MLTKRKNIDRDTWSNALSCRQFFMLSQHERDLGPIINYLHLLTDLPKTMLSTIEPMVKLEEEMDSLVP